MWHPTYSPLQLRRSMVHVLASGAGWGCCLAVVQGCACCAAAMLHRPRTSRLSTHRLCPAPSLAGARSHSEVGDELPYELGHSPHFDQVGWRWGALWGCCVGGGGGSRRVTQAAAAAAPSGAPRSRPASPNPAQAGAG